MKNTLPVKKIAAQMPAHALDVTGAPGQPVLCCFQNIGQPIKEQASQAGVPEQAGKGKGPLLLKQFIQTLFHNRKLPAFPHLLVKPLFYLMYKIIVQFSGAPGFPLHKGYGCLFISPGWGNPTLGKGPTSEPAAH